MKTKDGVVVSALHASANYFNKIGMWWHMTMTPAVALGRPANMEDLNQILVLLSRLEEHKSRVYRIAVDR